MILAKEYEGELWIKASLHNREVKRAVEAEREACKQIVHDTYEGFGVGARGVEFIKNRIIEQIEARWQK